MMQLKTYRMVLAYDGTEYHGWQVQPNGISIQQVLEEALCVLLKEPVRIIGAGRTDAGVHALGQVAHFRTELSLDVDRIFKALNGILPLDIRVLAFSQVHPRFHANRSAYKKIYHYSICLQPFTLPFERRYTLLFRPKLNIALVQEAASLFVGKHDFTAFANVNGGAAIEKNPYRTIYRLDCLPTSTGIRLEFEGDGFFYKMVRNITGMLLAVGSGKRTLQDIETVFESRDRTKGEKAVPAHGLMLMQVFYPDELLFPIKDFVNTAEDDDALAFPE